MTLIEVVIVVFVAGIVAALAAPLVASAITDAQLYGAASEVVTALEFAQLSALSTGRACRVTVDTAADSLTVAQLEYSADFMGADTELPEADVEAESYVTMEHPVKGASAYVVSFAAEGRFGASDITAAAFGAGNSVEFDALGAPSSGGAVTVVCKNMQATITLDAVSGKVTANI